MSATAKRRSPARGATTPRCVWLAADLLLVSRLPAAVEWSAAVRAGRRSQPIEAGGIVFSRPGGKPCGVLLARLAGNTRTSAPDAVVLTGDGVESKLDRQALAKSEVSLEQLIQEDLGDADPASRAALGDLLRRLALPALEGPGAMALAMRLRELRDTLAEPLPELIPQPESPLLASLDQILAVDERSVWVTGWVRDLDRTLRSLVIISPEGLRTEVLDRTHRYPRPDVAEAYGDGPEERHGFAAYIQLAAPSLLTRGWSAVLARADGSGVRISAPDVEHDSDTIRGRLLGEFEKESPDRRRFRVDHVLPAVSRLQQRYASHVQIDDITQHGAPPVAPAVSIVIPLYGRVDLVEHQLAHFGRDHQLTGADIVYVLDSPELWPELEPHVADLHALHGVPFRVVRLSRNAGYPGANNIGVGQAVGRLVLLLNSDVIPVERGWLGRMAAFYDSTPDIGALGPKLLYEDLSIQHAGMYFKRELRTSLWGNQHYFKGLHRDFGTARVSRTVPAVTGACMMLARELYLQLGGLREGFVRGGYEDSDLCIRAVEQGRRNWYLADVELYHLEAQSFVSAAPRSLATSYNTWLQTYLWDEVIERIMQEQASYDAGAGLNRPSRLAHVA